MIRRAIPPLLAVGLGLSPMPLGAKIGEFTGDDFLRHCTTGNPNWKPQNSGEQEMALYCFGYIEAAVALIVLSDGFSYCLPKGGTPQDILKATAAFMEAHSDQKQYLLASIMLAAVQDKWPCSSK